MRFPLGPDAPVYLWWARIAGEEGLATVGHRPGAAALALVVQGALGRSVVEAVAALEIALGVAVGLLAAALLRPRGRLVWLLGGALAGTFAVHLAAGYLANLLQVVAFLAAAVGLAEGTRRGAVLAAASIAAGAFAHPPFAALGSAILLLAAAFAWRRDRAAAIREGLAVVGGSALGGVVLLTMPDVPPRPEVDTSRDALLRRAGLTGELRSAYRHRFLRRWTRYVQWVSVPLAAVGLPGQGGFVGRFLLSWAVATVAGVAFGLATGVVPPDRLVTFGFVVPILAALGVGRIAGRLGRPVVAAAVAGGLAVAMVAGSFIAWDRQRPFLTVEEVRAAEIANASIVRLDPGVPLAFLVNAEDRTATFEATRAANVLRAAVPPDRIRDVVVVVPAGSDPAGEERAALERLTAADRHRAERRSGRPAATFLLRPFDPVDDPSAAGGPGDPLVIDGTSTMAGEPAEPLRASSPVALALSGALALGLFAAAGYGWARAVVRDRGTALALAPGVGAAALVLVAVGLERFDLLLQDPAGAWLVSGIAGGGGYAAWGVLQRLARPGSAAKVQQ